MDSIVEISNVQKKEIEQALIKDNYFIAEIDGEKIETLPQYMEAIKKAFEFPEAMFENTSSIDSYLDWMRDLSWLGNKEGYVLFIINSSKMMIGEEAKKAILFETFKDAIIPFWKDEVEHVVVDGEKKEFKVFIEK
ncbi:barstar family protein [Enterococcus sp. BWB1-3]|uniref:barstar family protein n=1 Tax=Enterococcus sp. BWB1-3 TaxID=2787713 RepID=UPI001921F5CD|nr:barstar family protein [Enterococcus sp. BWB1-3]MBL1229830.1 barstar family protein [Enterococcus sp. BWB1-3]